jgi:hypothetical protein
MLRAAPQHTRMHSQANALSAVLHMLQKLCKCSAEAVLWRGVLQNADPDVRVDMETFLNQTVPEVGQQQTASANNYLCSLATDFQMVQRLSLHIMCCTLVGAGCKQQLQLHCDPLAGKQTFNAHPTKLPIQAELAATINCYATACLLCAAGAWRAVGAHR